MFVWISSDGRRTGFGGCGLSLLMTLLLCMLSGSGNTSVLLLFVLIGLFMLFVLPRLSTASGPTYIEPDEAKRKNDEYLDKPKRDDQYIVGADGEVLDVIDEQSPDYNRPHADDVY
jgi:hypothetical protein